MRPERLDEARKALENELTINQSEPWALRLAADVYKKAGDLRTAAELLDRLSVVAPEDAALWAELGELRYRLKDLPAAEASLLHARELNVVDAFTRRSRV